MAISPVSTSSVSSLRDLLTARPKASATETKSTSPAREILNEKQGAKVVDKAAANATKTFEELDSLRQDLAAATKAGADISTDEVKKLNDRLTKVRTEIDRLAADAKVGNTNLLTDKGSVTIASNSGESVRVTGQALDSKALGLDKLEIKDADSLRQAAGKVALATGQTQNSVFSLQAASGTLKPQETNPGIEAFEKARAARNATPAAGSAAASVEQALANQAAVNTRGYGASGRAAAGSTRTASILDLFA